MCGPDLKNIQSGIRKVGFSRDLASSVDADLSPDFAD
jgi:hypothetical protein